MKNQKQISVEDFNILDVAAFMARCWRWILIYVILFAGVTVHNHRQNPKFTASGTLLLEGARPNSLQAIADKFVGGGSMGESKEEQLERYVLILNSRFFLESVANHVMQSPRYGEFLQILGLDGSGGVTYSKEQIVELVQGNISISRYKNDFIKVESTNASPRKAVDIANIGLEAVKSAIIESESAEANGGRQFFENQIREMQARIDAVDQQIMGHKGSYFPDGTSRERQRAETQVNSLTTQFFEKKVKLEEEENQLRELERQVAERGQDTTSIDKYSPEVEIAEKRRAVSLLRKERDAYKRVLDRLQAEGEGLPGAEHRMADLYKKKEMEYRLMNEFKRELTLTNIQMISVAHRVKVLQPAEHGSVASRNLIPDLVKRSLLAILLAILTVYALESYNPVVRSKRDLGGFPAFFVGSIPRLESLDRKRIRSVLYWFLPFLEKRQTREEMRNVELKPDSIVDIVFKNIRAHVVALGSKGDLPPKVISVVSPLSGEGKTMLANGLGKSLAAGGARVLLVDCDIRRHSLTQSWGLAGVTGITEYLSEPSKDFEGKVVKRVAPRLDVLPAGGYSANCSELIASTQFSDLLKALASFYDFIVIDTPPVVPYSEVFSIAAASDLLLFSVAVKETTVDSLEKSFERIRFVNPTPAIGYVLNKYDSFTYYSYYYSQEGNKVSPHPRAQSRGNLAA